ncbi:hypothetical protein EJ08DRAFT_701956 [Tothia fuscella]|uniref:Uncharacterized protein n=1 Tax=Tothia fuscella TaxID=1048955 RepID=A0A9P4TUC6_9PEZI|nr:hypothetical protein EJ08DRAFT_701956 [Tothia fuscella]
MATTKNPVAAPGLRARPSIRQKLRALFKRRNSSKLGNITPSPTRSSTEIGSPPNNTPNLARKRMSKQEKDLKAEKRRSRNDLSIANEYMGSGGGLMGLNFEEGGLEDLKMSFETGDDAYTFGSPTKSVRSPLSMEMAVAEDEAEEKEDELNQNGHIQPQDQVPELLPKAKKWEVKTEGSLRPVSRASANPAAEKVSKAIETINKNKITRQPLTDSTSVNTSKRNSVESKRNSLDTTRRYSTDITQRQSTDTANKRHSLGASTIRSNANKVEPSRPLSMIQTRGGPQKAMAVMESAGVEPDTSRRKSAVIDTPIANRFSNSHLQTRDGPEKAVAVMESAEPEAPTSSRNSMSHIQVRGGPQKALAVMESAGVAPPPSKRYSLSNISIRDGPEKQNAVLDSAAHSRQASTATEPRLDPLKMHPPEIRGGPQKQNAVLESTGYGRERSSTNESISRQSVYAPVEVRGGPQKAAAVMDSSRHARNTSTSSRASNRYSVGDVESLLNTYEQASDSAKRMSHPPLTNRRSFSEPPQGSQPATEQSSTASASLSRKASGRKTAERLAWIRELEEGNKSSGNHGRDYMFNKLQGGVKEKLRAFESQKKELTGGIARSNSNVSRRFSSNSSDAYSIETSAALQRISRSAAVDDEFKRKLEGTVAEQQRKRAVPQEVLDLVALTDGDPEEALNDLMRYWNQEELVKQINDAADSAGKAPTEQEKLSGKAKESAKSASVPPFSSTTRSVEKKATGLPSVAAVSAQVEKERLPELRKVQTPEAPKISSWNPKPNLKSEPMRAANGATILSMPDSTGSKWNSKPNPTPAPTMRRDEPAKEETPKVDVSQSEKTRVETIALPKVDDGKSEPTVEKPAASVLPAVPASPLTGSNVPGAKWTPKPNAKAEETKQVEMEAKPPLEPVEMKPISDTAPSKKSPDVTPVPAPIQKSATKEISTPKSPTKTKTPAPLALSRSNGNASKSPYSSPTKSNFTAATLPSFA